MKSRQIFYPKYYLKLLFRGKVVYDVHTKKIGRILFRIRGIWDNDKWDKAILTFKYAKGYENKGIYHNTKDLEHTFRCFSEVINEF